MGSTFTLGFFRLLVFSYTPSASSYTPSEALCDLAVVAVGNSGISEFLGKVW